MCIRDSSCDRRNRGCKGGSIGSPIQYIFDKGGLVPDACLPYKGKDTPCPTECEDKRKLDTVRKCKCLEAASCSRTLGIKTCLKEGPTPIAFEVKRSFLNYKNGIYECDWSQHLGYHGVLAMGFADTPECYYTVKNSWGIFWGDKGYFKIGCRTCNIWGGVVCIKFG
eukprot:TRINITY_DN1607_c0_g1_i8.p1 TRINITY_DN1607_c0_g1~~TRINITY_DN1607_c0_g1_i8.p1  ORF type:complete len:167 (+),score=26.42 TRINITY_DN1607_c0_g1_i8:73-573(+)